MKKTALCLLLVLMAAFEAFTQNSFQWGYTIADEGTRNQANSVVTNSKQESYTTGAFTGRIDFGTTIIESKGSQDVFVSKLDMDGKCIWAFSLGNVNFNDGGMGVALHPSGNGIFVTGFFQGTVNFDPKGTAELTSFENTVDVFVAAYDAEGNFLWVKSAGGDGADVPNGICTDAFGGVYLTGFFTGAKIDLDPPNRKEFNNSNQGTRDIFIVKYDEKAAFQFGGTLGSATGKGQDEGKSIFVESGALYVGGYFSGTMQFDFIGGKGNQVSALQQDGFLARYSAAEGTLDWAGAVGGESMDEVSGITAVSGKSEGLVCVTGYFSPGTADFDMGVGVIAATSYGGKDIFVAQYNSFGKFNWGHTFGSDADDEGKGIDVSASGFIYLTGYFNGSVDFDPGLKNTAILTGYKGTVPAIFMGKYDDAGNYYWAQAIAGSASSQGQGVSADGEGGLYLAGCAGGSGELEPGKVAFTADIQGDIVLAKYNTRLTQAITFAALPAKNFGDAAFTVSATASSGLPVSFTSSNPAVATISGTTITIVGSGTSTITASQTGNTNFNAAPSVAQTLTVNKVNQTITFAALPAKNFGDPAFTLSAAASSDLVVSFTSSNPAVATISGTTVTVVGVGTTTITAAQAGNGNYHAAVLVSQTLTVNKADQTITFGPIPAKNFGDASFTVSAIASSGLVVSFTSSNPAVATVSGTTITIIGVGTSTITATQAGNANYNAATPAPRTLTINKASQTISFGPLSPKNYGAAPFTISATASSGLAVSFSSSDPSVATISGTTVTIVGVGSTVITANQAGNATFEGATPVAQTLIVNKLNQIISFGAISAKNFGAAPFTISASASSGLPVSFFSDNPSVATVSGNAVTIVGTGTASITASQEGNTNYNAAPMAAQTLTVNKASQTINFAALASVKFGDPAFAISASASSGLPVSFTSSDPSVVSISGNTITVLAPGTSIITASQTGNVNYNAAVSVAHTFVVNKADQTISFAAIPPKNFDDAPFTITANASSGLAVSFSSDNSSVATISGNTITIVAAGTATITAIQAGNANYNAAPSVSHILSINNSNQSISFAPLPSKNFGDPAFTISATASSGLPVSFSSNNPSVATVTGNTVTILGAGSAVITASQSGDANFGPATPVAQTLTVAKLEQTISFASLPVKVYGEASFTLTATTSSTLPVTFSSDNLSVATVSGNTITIVGAGSAIITASQSGNTNYNDAAPVEQVLTVNKANQTLSFPALPAKAYTGEPPFSIAATASSGLPVVFTSSDESKLSISGNTLTILAVGAVTITASQEGDSNFNAALSQQQTIMIELPEMDIIGRATVAENTTQYYSVLPVLDGYNYYWYYSDKSVDLHDSSGARTAITFQPLSSDGTIYCDVYTPAGVYFHTLNIPVKVNHKLNFTVPTPNCLELDSINPCSGVYIDYFKISSLENISTGCSSGGYADYTQSEFTTKLSLSDIYTPEIRLGYNGTGTPTFFVGFWIDFDNNGSFEDAGEFLSSFYGSATSFPLHSIRVSNNSEHEGPRRMRVRVRTSGSFTSADGCIQQGDKGETEDYLVILSGSTKLAASSALTPNNDGKNDYFYIKGIEAGAANKLVIFDRTGKVWFSEENYNNTWGGHSNRGSLLPVGTYYYVFTYGDVQVKGFFELLY